MNKDFCDFNVPVSVLVPTEYKSIFCFDGKNDVNIDAKVVESFGDEWSKFDSFDQDEIENLGAKYFDILTPQIINKSTYAIDIGCGSGRFSKYLAGKVKFIEAVDPSEAIFVANKLLKDHTNIRLSKASVDSIPFADYTFDFAMSVGVLHHMPDTQKGMQDCIAKLKIGGYFYTYLYYNLDNKGMLSRAVLFLVSGVRKIISSLPGKLKRLICDLIAIFIYMPIVLAGRLMKKIWLKKIADRMFLSAYHDQSFFIIRNDALDRFGTRLEQRFSRSEIEQMMKNCGLDEIVISENMPYWHAVGKRIR